MLLSLCAAGVLSIVMRKTLADAIHAGRHTCSDIKRYDLYSAGILARNNYHAQMRCVECDDNAQAS